MNGRERDDGTFADAVDDVTPLAGRDKLRPQPRGSRVREAAEEIPTFEVERAGSRATGRVDGVSRRELRRLASGAIPVEGEIDLHGLDRAAAERVVRKEITRAREAGVRCVLVIHGRGRHSESGAVLAEALPGWLQAAPLAGHVLAFATAPEARGGSGATFVRLRRQSSGRGRILSG